MRNYEPQPGETWTHFKGGKYQIIDLAKDVSRSNRDVPGVIYRSSDGAIYFRRIQNFMSTVDRGNEVVYRFDRC
jgi:hypothetical protein